MFELRTLGSISLTDGEGVSVRSVLSQPKRLALLTYLAVAGRSRSLRREHLVATFWEESDAEHGRASLRRALHYLRRSMGEDVLVGHGDEEVGVDPTELSCDVARFEAALEAGRDEEALALYAGDFLEAFYAPEAAPFEEWLDAKRSRLRQQAAEAALRVADSAQRRGNRAAARSALERALALEPHSEATARRLMSALAEGGDRAAALRVHDEFVGRLERELDLEPAAETTELAERLRRSEPSPAFTALPVEGEPHAGAATASATAPGGGAGEGAEPPVREPNLKPDPFAHAPDRSGRTPWPGIAVGAVATALVAAVFLSMSGSTDSNGEPSPRFHLALPVESLAGSLDRPTLALSPDGSALVHGGPGPAGRLLWLKPSDRLRGTPIEGTEEGYNPAFSPNGRWLAFLRRSPRGLNVVRVDGSVPMTLAVTGFQTAGLAWGADGHLYLDGVRGLVRISTEGGAFVPVSVLDTVAGELSHNWPEALPDGDGVLFTVVYGPDHGRSQVAVVRPGRGPHRTLFTGVRARYSATGHVVYVTAEGTLMAVPFDVRRLETTGPAIALAGGVRLGADGAVDLAVSAAGAVVYREGLAQAQTEQIVRVSRDGAFQPIDPGWTGDFESLSLSPDGRRLAVSAVGRQRHDLWVKQLDSGPLGQLTFDGSVSWRPHWSVDGAWLTYVSDRAGPFDLWRVPAHGGGAPEPVLDHPSHVLEARRSPDGRALVLRVFEPAEEDEDLVVRIDGETRSLVEQPFDERWPAISPDGRWIAYASNETGAFQIFVHPFPEVGSGRWQLSTGGGTDPLWDPTGGSLFYRSRDGSVVEVVLTEGATFGVAGERVLFPGREYQMDGFVWDMTPDGHWFVMIRALTPRTETEASQVVLIQDLTRGLGALR